jgi:hypothetical protein
MDFGRGICWDAFQLVKEVHQCDFKSALKIINQDFGLNLDTKSPKKIKRQLIEYKPEVIENDDPAYKLDFIPGEWTDGHFAYWTQYGHSIYTPQIFDVVPVSAIISSGKITELGDEIAFAYTENLPYLKILRPFADKRSKWRSTCKKDQLHGKLYGASRYEVITKSKKDVMTLYQMGILATSVMSESADPSWYDEETTATFKDALVLMDSDEAGRICAAKWEEAGYKTIFVPEEYKAKDISDLVLEIGFENAKAWIQTHLS